jgi:hypothetical protein
MVTLGLDQSYGHPFMPPISLGGFIEILCKSSYIRQSFVFTYLVAGLELNFEERSMNESCLRDIYGSFYISDASPKGRSLYSPPFVVRKRGRLTSPRQHNLRSKV